MSDADSIREPWDDSIDLNLPEAANELAEPEAVSSRNATGFLKTGAAHLGNASRYAFGTARSGLAAAIVTGIRMVSAERDRDEIIRWFVEARSILSQGRPKTETAKSLYQSIDTLRFAKLLTNTVRTSIANYRGANLPLSLKVAMPITAVGAAFFGTQYAGLVAMGGGIGLPVLLLLFLGTAGATSVIEGFIKDRSIRDPLTKLLLAFVAMETSRQAKKELLDAMRADAMVPERVQTPDDPSAQLAFLMQMDPIAFERHVMSFFEKCGFPTGLTARSNDFGVDGYVFHPDGIVIVQCKRYGEDNPVGRPAIQQFKGVIEEQRAFRGYFVTTSRFTNEATESAAKSDRICLVNGSELLRWHKDGMSLK
ncbi:restriction endonuclease [Planctomicrobium sp. SH661]|uniref:restriction endonuclease n=1 Tax=Planctomicrobium sp. SH661 TaxID=3448124 RepID=UPI003F5BFF5C